ncbi:hypothetical protein PICSAR143_02810 [Mycobacterium avium subsp. paratuberculosis]|nr:hypothetical protein PICSAR143_02810 [Mycobacterium avium subsp. paratuberculosis]CAG7455959.1 hypothetical protein PICSAR144_03461 [Mycobacterium avium subsp. paratuberculosis]
MGTTTVTCSTARWPSSSAATRSANVVLPEPGVATARKSRGCPARYFTSARRCQPRSAPERSLWSLPARGSKLLTGTDTGPQSLLLDAASSIERRL